MNKLIVVLGFIFFSSYAFGPTYAFQTTKLTVQPTCVSPGDYCYEASCYCCSGYTVGNGQQCPYAGK